MRGLKILCVGLIFALVSCGPNQLELRQSRVAFIGDSVFAWFQGSQQSVPDQTSEILGHPIASFAVSGAQADYVLPITGAIGFDIRKQLRGNNWQTVVVNGGANDVYFECLCLQCQAVVDRLVSEDGERGTLPELLRDTMGRSERVLYSGYHRTGGLGGPYDRCADELNIIEARIAKLAARTPGLEFVDMRDVFPKRDRSFYDGDLIHPSVKGAGAMASRLANAIGPVRTSIQQ